MLVQPTCLKSTPFRDWLRWALLAQLRHSFGSAADAKNNCVSLAIKSMLVLVAVLGVLTFLGMEFITNAVR
jgi:hypothetical protein